MELTEGKEKELVSDYRESKQRLILLDYDGTLVPFFKRPEDANPGEEILKLLETLATDPKNEVVLTSGRDRDTMEKWFGGGIDYIAEHGAFIKEKGKLATITGRLLLADARHSGREKIQLIDDVGQAHNVIVPEGMMSDIVRPLWEERVQVTGYYRGKSIRLEDINRVPEG